MKKIIIFTNKTLEKHDEEIANDSYRLGYSHGYTTGKKNAQEELINEINSFLNRIIEIIGLEEIEKNVYVDISLRLLTQYKEKLDKKTTTYNTSKQ